MITKVFGALIFGFSLWVLYAFEQAGMPANFRLLFWPAIVLTFLGPVGLLLLSCDREQVSDTLDFMLADSLGRARKQIDHEFALLRKIGNDYYMRGSRAFDVKDAEMSAPIAKTLERLSIRVPFLDAIDLLERERDQYSARFQSSLSMISLGTRLAPSVGMLGTIIGMSQLLGHLKDPENIGASMSVALLTTFYGLFFSLALWTPIQHHLNRLLALKMRSFEQALHWLEILQSRKPADYLGEEEVKAELKSGRAPVENGISAV